MHSLCALFTLLLLLSLGCDGSMSAPEDAAVGDSGTPNSGADGGRSPDGSASDAPPRSDGSPGDRAPTDVGMPMPGDHGYFEWLIDRPELHHMVELRSQAEIDANLHGRVGDPLRVVMDPAVDGARMIMPSGGGSIEQQMRIDFAEVSTGTLLFYWEGRWESGFVRDGDIDGLETNKAYQLAKDGPGDDRRIEPRTRFLAADAPFVAAVDTRVYNFTPSLGESQPIEPQVGEFFVRPDVWVRFWALVEFDSNTYSFWVADETTAPVLIHDDLGLDYGTYPMGSAGLNQFWFEHNSSQSRESGTAPLSVWGRNFAVLRDPADAAALVAQYEP